MAVKYDSDDFRQKGVEYYPGKRHQNKDKLNKFKGDIHIDEFTDEDDNEGEVSD